MGFLGEKGNRVIRRTTARLDKSLILLGVGLLIGASMGFVFTWLEDTGRTFLSGTSASTGRTGPPRLGESAPDFELLDLDGKPIRLAHLIGNPVLINFWATWCPPCRQEIPLIEELHQQYPNLIVLAVNADESKSTVGAFAATYMMATIVLLDPGAIVNDQYYVDGLPTSFFLDAEGVIRSVQIGLLTQESLEGHLFKIGLSK